jgi:hypothetical protein
MRDLGGQFVHWSGSMYVYNFPGIPVFS